MTNRYVTDTHALVWHLQKSSKLSAVAQSIFYQVDHGQGTIFIPTIVLVELIYLGEKGRVSATLIELVSGLLRSGSQNYQLAPLGLNVVENLSLVPRNVVPDMPDRIITATALFLNLPLLTKDSAITKVDNLQALW